jgi:hypothetical protein
LSRRSQGVLRQQDQIDRAWLDFERESRDGRKELFKQYESVFNRSLRDRGDMNELASVYACDVIGVAPAEVAKPSNHKPVVGGQSKA